MCRCCAVDIYEVVVCILIYNDSIRAQLLFCFLTSNATLLFAANDVKSSNFENLHKVRIDNMKEYQERKQARLAQKAQKRVNKTDGVTAPTSTDKLQLTTHDEQRPNKLLKTNVIKSSF